MGKECEENSALIRCIMAKVKKLISGGGSGIPDAPIDGEQYARQDGNWEEVLIPTLQQVVDRNNGVIGSNIFFQNNDYIYNITATGNYLSLNYNDYNINSIGIDSGGGTINKTYGYLALSIADLDETNRKGSLILANPNSINASGKFYLPLNGPDPLQPLTLAKESAISGTFANPTSITVTNGIITAIS